MKSTKKKGENYIIFSLTLWIKKFSESGHLCGYKEIGKAIRPEKENS